MEALILILFGLFVVFSPDPLALAYSGMALYWLINATWKKNENKVLFVSLIFYWMTTSILLPYGVLTQQSLASLSNAKPTILHTHFLAVTALVIYTFGISWQIRNIKTNRLEDIKKLFLLYDGRKLLFIYVVYSIFSSFLERVFLGVSIGQLLFGFIYMKWSFLAVLTIHTIFSAQNRTIVIVLISIEILLSFAGFWSSFKDYLLIITAAVLTTTSRISFRSILFLAFFGAIAFVLSSIWSYSKGEYRQYLTGGFRSQSVVQTDTWKNLSELNSILSKDFSRSNYKNSFNLGSKSLVDRVSYIEYFAMTVNFVPNQLPFEGGLLLDNAIKHVTQPRFLFPNKKIIDDSEITSKYTGRRFSGIKEGSSFSLGLVAEQYIDFGPINMFIPIFFFGAWIGYLYKTIKNNSFNPVWGMGFIAPLLFLIPSLGVPTAKFIAWTIYYLVAYLVMNYLIIPMVNPLLLRADLKENISARKV